MWLWLQQIRILPPSLSVSGSSASRTQTCLHKWKIYLEDDNFVTHCVFAITADPLQTWGETTLSSPCLHPAIPMTYFCIGVQQMDSTSMSEILKSRLQGWTTASTRGIHFALHGTLCLDWVSCGWMEVTRQESPAALDPTSVATSSSS